MANDGNEFEQMNDQPEEINNNNNNDNNNENNNNNNNDNNNEQIEENVNENNNINANEAHIQGDGENHEGAGNNNEEHPQENPNEAYEPEMNAIINNNGLSKEERKAQIVAFAHKRIAEIQNIRGGDSTAQQDRRNQISFFQNIIDSNKSFDELVTASIELSNQKKEEAKRLNERKQEMERQAEQAQANRFVNDDVNNNANENEAANHPGPNIPDFQTKLQENMGSEAVTGEVRKQLTEIFRAAGIAEQEKVNDAVEKSFSEIRGSLNSLYDPNAEQLNEMSHDAKVFFYNAYQSLDGSNLNGKDRIITAQKIADVMLKKYSPVAFTENELAQYADNYVVNNKDVLKEQLAELHVENIDALVGEVEAALANENQNVLNGNDPHMEEQQPDQDQNPNPVVNEDANNQKSPEEIAAFNHGKVEMFAQKLKDFNSMYKTEQGAEQFGGVLAAAWENIISDDPKKVETGKNMLSSLFKGMIKEAFSVEKTESYNEHRLPMYSDILKSANEVLRSAMFAYTDLYHNPERASKFKETAFGGMSLKDITKYTRESELWRMDQKSDEAWKIQSQEAMEFVDKWKKEERPFEKMITDMNKIMELARGKTGVSRRDAIMQLAAAEYLLINDERMTIDDPADPLNPIPDWGNRYWKKLIEVRETLGIDKHTSIRDMIQADYAAAAKGANSIEFHEKQIRENVMGENALATVDSIDKQKELFATQSGFFALTEPPKEIEMTADRTPFPVRELDQRLLMANEPRDFTRIIDQKQYIKRDAPEQAPKGKK